MQSNLQILKLDPNAKFPKRQTEGSAGYDLYSLIPGSVKPRSHVMIPTGIAAKLPLNTYARIASRSGLSLRNGIEVGGGVIDSDYFPGHIQIILFNHSDDEFQFDMHTRIAQLIITSILTPEIGEIFERGKNNNHGGFGSTGLT